MHQHACSPPQQSSAAPPALQALIRHNIGLNAAAAARAGGSAAAAVLAWGATDPTTLGSAWAAPDLVVAADVVYHRDLFAPLLSTLAAFGARRSGRPAPRPGSRPSAARARPGR
jgi:predicted nicotinamide N-methyase